MLKQFAASRRNRVGSSNSESDASVVEMGSKGDAKMAEMTKKPPGGGFVVR
jgi:hypothetical protein